MIRKFIDNLKSYIEISNFERRGVFALLFSCILVAGYYYYKNSQTSSAVQFTDEELAAYEAHIDSAFLERNKQEVYLPKDRGVRREIAKVGYLPFNPNSDNEKQLLKAGVPPYVVNSLINYRTKGGDFQRKSDFKKLYVVDEELYEELKPYILLPEEVILDTDAEISDANGKELSIRPVDINAASADDLIALKGIGEVFAGRIIKYRDLLGGFHDKRQLIEVYGLPEETYTAIEDDIVTVTKPKATIFINSGSYDELAKHPYLSYKKAKSIVAYRQQHGKYTSGKDLSKLHLLSESDVDRILPYLDLN